MIYLSDLTVSLIKPSTPPSTTPINMSQASAPRTRHLRSCKKVGSLPPSSCSHSAPEYHLSASLPACYGGSQPKPTSELTDNTHIVHLLFYKFQSPIDGHDCLVLVLLEQDRPDEFVYVCIILELGKLLKSPLSNHPLEARVNVDRFPTF